MSLLSNTSPPRSPSPGAMVSEMVRWGGEEGRFDMQLFYWLQKFKALVGTGWAISLFCTGWTRKHSSHLVGALFLALFSVWRDVSQEP